MTLSYSNKICRVFSSLSLCKGRREEKSIYLSEWIKDLCFSVTWKHNGIEFLTRSKKYFSHHNVYLFDEVHLNCSNLKVQGRTSRAAGSTMVMIVVHFDLMESTVRIIQHVDVLRTYCGFLVPCPMISVSMSIPNL